MKIKMLSSYIASIKLQLANFKTLAIGQGQYASIKSGKPIDSSGNAIPWYTYPAIEYFSQLDFSAKNVFEFGCGNSSIFWAKKTKRVVSVDDNKEWIQRVKKNALNNQEIIFAEKKADYISAIDKFNEKFDIVIVDAKYRDACAEKAVEKVKDDGMIILDNSDWYPDVAKFIRERGYIQVDFAGFGPVNGYAWVTSVFLSRKIQIKSINKNQPQYCIGGIKQYAKE